MDLNIPKVRLQNQQLAAQKFEKPEDVVTWFGAMQSQDFAAAKWAIALRCKKQTDASIEQAFNEGKILRTHVMRPTWHFVAPADIRWLLALTAPRVHRFNGSYYRKSGLDTTIFQKSNTIIRNALQGGKQLTRAELNIHLKDAHIPTAHLGLSFTIMQAELDGIIVSGPRRGKQFTYMLLEERVPKTISKTFDEALAELTKRYFQSHGPAQVQDFSWWSGLTMTDCKKGIEMVRSTLQKSEQNGKTYWYNQTEDPKISTDETFLLPGFDEYFIAYTDRSDVLDKDYAKELNQGGGMVNGAVVVKGRMAGGWKREFKGKSVVLSLKLFEKLSAIQMKSLEQQTKHFGNFLNMPLETKNIEFLVPRT
ncbi:MAG: winged helix DNA-binding domain-containing protein [Rhabdochlamydiaceae bacterium]